MNGNDISLRSLVDKWLAPTLSMPARVIKHGRMLTTQSSYVRVEGRNSSGPLSIVFFRHGDGSWCVFPPVRTEPAMCACLLAH